MRFLFRGGSYHPSQYTLDKFYLFLLLEGKEIPLYQAVKSCLVKEVSLDNYESNIDLIKIFIVQRGFNCAPKRKTFFFKLKQNEPAVKIISFSGEKGGIFNADGCLLTKEKGMSLLENPTSIKYLRAEGSLSIDVLKKLVTIDRSKLRKGLRYIRVGGNNK